jgi:hypothetical protein
MSTAIRLVSATISAISASDVTAFATTILAITTQPEVGAAVGEGVGRGVGVGVGAGVGMEVMGLHEWAL